MADRFADQDLAALRVSRHALRRVDRCAERATAALEHLADVEADPDADVLLGMLTAVLFERLLDRDRAADRLAGRRNVIMKPSPIESISRPPCLPIASRTIRRWLSIALRATSPPTRRLSAVEPSTSVNIRVTTPLSRWSTAITTFWAILSAGRGLGDPS